MKQHIGHKRMHGPLYSRFRTLHGRPVLAVLDQGVVSATGMATALLIGRTAGPSELGVFALGLAGLLFADQLFAAVTSTPYMILGPARRPFLRQPLAGSLFLHVSLLSGICAALLAVGMKLFGGGVATSPTHRAMWAIAATLVPYALSQCVRRYLFVEMRFRAALVADAAVALLQLGALAALWFAGALTGATALGATAGAKLLGMGPVLLTSRIGWSGRRRYSISHALRAWRLGRWVLLATVLWSLTAQAYPWLLTALHDAAAAGLWAACMSMGNLMNPILIGGQNLAGPRLVAVYAAETEMQARQFTFRLSGLFLASLAPMALLLSLYGGRLLTLLYGPAYSGQGAVVAVYGWSIVIAGMAFPISRALFAKERTDLDLVGSLASVGAVGSVGLVLIRALGPFGAAASALLANAVGGVSRYALLCRSLDRKPVTKPSMHCVLRGP